jgi:C-terminal processing protease CtpA/Prc
VHEVYKNGAADKDGRLQPGDRIVSVNGTAFNDLTHEEALRILRSSQDKVGSVQLGLFLNCFVPLYKISHPNK